MVSPMSAREIVDEERVEPPVSQGTLRSADGAALPLDRTEVEARVGGPLADVTVRQRFRNDRGVAIEAVYLFPLPPEASVYAMRFRIEDRVVEGVVKEKAAARRDYEAALAEGRAATLLEEDRPALFTLSVANVAPGAVIEVELSYQDLLPYDDGRWRFLFPMVAPARYREGSGDAPRSRDPSRDADVTVSVRFSEETRVEELSSPSHLVSIERDADGALRARLRLDGPVANRDFSLTWRAAEEGVRPWLFVERAPAAQGAFLLVLTPSASRATTERAGGEGDLKAVRCGNCGGVVRDLSAVRDIPGLGPVVPCAFCGAVLAPGVDVITAPRRPRDVLVLVDRSASMRGAQGQCVAAVRAVLGALAPGDAAQVAVFDHDREALDGHAWRFVPLSPELVAQAVSFVESHGPRGGSELEAALAMSSAIAPREGRTRVVVLVSDVSAGNEARLLRRAPELLGAGARLFVLGVGEGVDRRLAERLARAGGGVAEVLPAGAGAVEALARFGRRVREAGPVLTDIALYWEGAAMEALEPAAVPDLYGGEALRVLGRFGGAGATRLVITALTAEGKPFRQELSVSLPAESKQAPGLERAWARRRVERLAERSDREPADPSHAAEGLRLSLAWSIVGRWTSLVAEDKKVSVGPRRARKATLYLNGALPLLSLDGARRTLGRGPEADLHIDETNVSRLHAEIVFDGASFVLRDLASTNGTRVDGETVREVVLRDGAVIAVGSWKIHVVFSTGEAPDGFFEYIPTQRAVDASSGEAGRRGAAVHASEHASLEGPMLRAAAPKGHFDGSIPLPAAAPARAPMGASASIPMGVPGAGPPPSFGAPGGPPKGARPMAPAPMAPPPVMAPSPMVPMMAPSPMRPSMPMQGAAPMAPPPGMAPPLSRGPVPVMAPAPMGAAPMAPAPMGAAPMGPMPLTTGSLGPMPSGFAPPPGVFGPPASASHAQPHAPSAPQVPVRAPGSEAYPEHELRWLSTRLRGELDLVFLVDATGSMGAHIAEVRARLLELVDALRASPLCKSLRLGVVAYRDHPPQERTFVTKVTALTDDIDAARAAVLALSAVGGGDGPEAATDGLFDVVRLAWRPGAARAVVWFGDAPPHGVEPSGDAWPAGCPCGNHWYTQAESCREMGIAVYAIGCLPTLRAYAGAEAVYRKVARATRGMFLPLREASLLVPLIAGAAESALDGQRIDAYLEALLAQHGATLHGVDPDERVRWITARFRAEGLRARAIEGDPERGALPLRFRDVTPVDVRASLARLQSAGRLAV